LRGGCRRYHALMSATTQITLEEFLDLPDTPGKQELLDGELIVVSPAKHTHRRTGKRVQRLLESVVDATNWPRLVDTRCQRDLARSAPG